MSQFTHYLTLPFLWQGLLIAIEISVAAFFGALPFALGVALMRMSRNRIVRWLPVPFIWVMRGTPILLQLLFWYNVLPLIGIHTSATVTAIIGLALNEIAFMAEIIRGGLLSVRQTQRDAAAALGLKRWQVLQRVVIPQALRTIVPAMSNEAIIIVKNTSLASVITVGELTLRSEQLAATNFEYVPVFLAAGVLYLLATSVIAVIQAWLEARLNIERRARHEARAALRAREAGQLALAPATPAAPSPNGEVASAPELASAPAVARSGSGEQLIRALQPSQQVQTRDGEPY